MVLTPEQQAELERLQNEASKPEPRTDTGIVGVLHAILDVLSGAVPHRSDWVALHSQAEAAAPASAPAPDSEPAAAPEPEPAAPEPAPLGTEGTGFGTG